MSMAQQTRRRKSKRLLSANRESQIRMTSGSKNSWDSSSVSQRKAKNWGLIFCSCWGDRGAGWVQESVLAGCHGTPRNLLDMNSYKQQARRERQARSGADGTGLPRKPRSVKGGSSCLLPANAVRSSDVFNYSQWRRALWSATVNTIDRKSVLQNSKT